MGNIEKWVSVVTHKWNLTKSTIVNCSRLCSHNWVYPPLHPIKSSFLWFKVADSTYILSIDRIVHRCSVHDALGDGVSLTLLRCVNLLLLLCADHLFFEWPPCVMLNTTWESTSVFEWPSVTRQCECTEKKASSIETFTLWSVHFIPSTRWLP